MNILITLSPDNLIYLNVLVVQIGEQTAVSFINFTEHL